MKKLVSIMLCVMMVLGLLPMAAFADAAAVELTVTPDKAEPKAGETVVFTVALGPVTAMGSVMTYVVIPEGLTVVKAEANAALDADFKTNEVTVIDNTVGYGLVDLQKEVAETGFTATGKTALFTITCTVDAGVHGEKTPTFLNTTDNFTAVGDKLGATIASTESATPVNVPKTSYVKPYTLTVSYADTLALTDATAKSVEAAVTAVDKEGDALPDSEKADLTFAFKGTAPAGLSIDAKTGKVTVTDAAKVVAGTVTVAATLTGATAVEANLTVTKAASAVTTVKAADNAPTTALIPPSADDAANEYTYAVEVLDQYDGAMTGQTVTWAATGAGLEAGKVEFDATTAKLTVKNGAKGGPVAITATVGDKTATINVNVTNISFAGVDEGVVATAGTYGDKLSDMVKVDGSKITATAGAAVAGTYTLVDADTVPAANDAVAYKVVFNSTDGTYENVTVKEGTVKVAKKEVTVTANDVTVKVGSDAADIPAELGWTATELVGEDKIAGTATYKFFALDEDGSKTETEVTTINTEEIADYAIVVSGLAVDPAASAGNYDVKFADGVLSVRKKNLKPIPIGQGTKPDGTIVNPDGTTTKPDGTKIDFVDVADEDWFAEAVDFVVTKGLFKGVSETEFAPNSDMTRAMVATVLYRLDGEHKTDVAAAFEDLAADTWYTDGVAWAAEKGVVKGLSETEFAPDANVTREQLATMLYRYAGEPEVTDAELTAFADAETVSDWAEAAMLWATKNEIIKGKDGSRLDPQGNATRAEVATMLQRFVNLEK